MDALKRKLRSLNSLKNESVDEIAGCFQKNVFQKGMVVIGAGWQPLPTLLYIADGLVRGTVDYQGNIYTLWVIDSGFLAEGDDFSKTMHSTHNIEFLKPSICYALSLSNVERLKNSNVALYRMIMEIYQEAFRDYNKRLILLNIRDAFERYRYLETCSPSLIKKLTDEQLSSILRIERKYLYRIKRRFSR